MLAKLGLLALLLQSVLSHGEHRAAAEVPDATLPNLPRHFSKTCNLKPLGAGKEDTTQILNAISTCGTNGVTNFAPGNYNITRKMQWNLKGAMVNMMPNAWLNFNPDVEYWLNSSNTYRAIFIQNQASWFILSGSDFTVTASNSGGIQGNGQIWWNFFSNRTRQDGDGRPVSLSIVNATRALVKGFRVEAQPFWCSAISMSQDVTVDTFSCNATNLNPAFFNTNVVPNTDGTDTYRSDRVTLKNWDVTCGDDCLAIKGNSTNIHIDGVNCFGGNGIAFGSLGQYGNIGLNDYVENVLLENAHNIRINATLQPGMKNGVYFKSWTGTVNGVPPTGGGGGGGAVNNIHIRNVTLDRVDLPVHLYQTNGGHTGDAPSKLQFSNLTFENWSGTATGGTIVNLQCSSAVPCPGMTFENFNITAPVAEKFICVNVVSESGLPNCTAS